MRRFVPFFAVAALVAGLLPGAVAAASGSPSPTPSPSTAPVTTPGPSASASAAPLAPTATPRGKAKGKNGNFTVSISPKSVAPGGQLKLTARYVGKPAKHGVSAALSINYSFCLAFPAGRAPKPPIASGVTPTPAPQPTALPTPTVGTLFPYAIVDPNVPGTPRQNVYRLVFADSAATSGGVTDLSVAVTGASIVGAGGSFVEPGAVYAYPTNKIALRSTTQVVLAAGSDLWIDGLTGQTPVVTVTVVRNGETLVDSTQTLAAPAPRTTPTASTVVAAAGNRKTTSTPLAACDPAYPASATKVMVTGKASASKRDGKSLTVYAPIPAEALPGEIKVQVNAAYGTTTATGVVTVKVRKSAKATPAPSALPSASPPGPCPSGVAVCTSGG